MVSFFDILPKKRPGTQTAVTQRPVKWKLMDLETGNWAFKNPQSIRFVIKGVFRNYFFQNWGLNGLFFDKGPKKALQNQACHHSKARKMESNGARDLKLGLK